MLLFPRPNKVLILAENSDFYVMENRYHQSNNMTMSNNLRGYEFPSLLSEVPAALLFVFTRGLTTKNLFVGH